VDINAVSKDHINVADALKRIGGNEDLYKRLLKRFLDGNEFEELGDALQNGDAEEAARLAHTIKGVSANLSLEKIRTASIDLELTIRAGLDSSADFANLMQTYSETKEEIVKLIG